MKLWLKYWLWYRWRPVSPEVDAVWRWARALADGDRQRAADISAKSWGLEPTPIVPATDAAVLPPPLFADSVKGDA